MANYLARVELFDADSAQYEELYEKMDNYGFSKYVITDDGKTYELPTGTYLGDRTEGVAVVRKYISSIANPLSSKAASVFVCSFDEGHWNSYLYPES